MPRICKEPCSGLAAAAIFIAAGAIQLLAGFILLRSEYVYLLAGPDFWTSATNIAIGCLVGVAASIWKKPRRRKTAIFIARYNLVTMLLVSCLCVNLITAIILILGESNALLSIYLEKYGRGKAVTVANETLAYAYAASIIAPVVCTIVAILSLVLKCPRKSPNVAKRVSKRRKKKKILSENSSSLYSWVFTPGTQIPLPPPLPDSIDSTRKVFDVAEPSNCADDTESVPKIGHTASSTEVNTVPMCVSHIQFTSAVVHLTESTDSSFSESNSPLAGDIIPVQINNSSIRRQLLGIPVPCPTVPNHAEDYENGETEVKTPIPSVCSVVSSDVTDHAKERSNNYNFGKRRASFTSFHGDISTDHLHTTKESCKKNDISKFQKRKRTYPTMFRMESITELPIEDYHDDVFESPHTAGYVSSPSVISQTSNPMVERMATRLRSSEGDEMPMKSTKIRQIFSNKRRTFANNT